MAATSEAAPTKRTRKVGPCEYRIQKKETVKVIDGNPDTPSEDIYIDLKAGSGGKEVFASTEEAADTLAEIGMKGEFRIIRVCSVRGKLSIRSVEKTIYE